MTAEQMGSVTLHVGTFATTKVALPIRVQLGEHASSTTSIILSTVAQCKTTMSTANPKAQTYTNKRTQASLRTQKRAHISHKLVKRHIKTQASLQNQVTEHANKDYTPLQNETLTGPHPDSAC